MRWGRMKIQMENKTLFILLVIVLINVLFISLGIAITGINTNQTLIEEQSTIIRGDVNGDGEITITDYTLIRLHILGLEELK